MLSDPIADLLTRIRNAFAARHKTIEAPHSKLKESLLKILKDNQYIKEVKVIGKKPKAKLSITLRYPQQQAAVSNLTRISKPGRRVYVSVSDLSKVTKGRGILILSTPKGLMTAKNAKKKNLGGEILCKVS